MNSLIDGGHQSKPDTYFVVIVFVVFAFLVVVFVVVVFVVIVFVVVVFLVVVIVVGEREGTDRGRPLIFRSVCRSELETAALLNY